MSSVRRSEKQTLHFGHCHLLHFSTTHTSVPSSVRKLHNLEAHNASSTQFPFKQFSRTSGGDLAKYQQNSFGGWATKNKALEERRRDTIGRKYSQNAASDCATEELPVCLLQHRLGNQVEKRKGSRSMAKLSWKPLSRPSYASNTCHLRSATRARIEVFPQR